MTDRLSNIDADTSDRHEWEIDWDDLRWLIVRLRTAESVIKVGRNLLREWNTDGQIATAIEELYDAVNAYENHR